MMLTDLSGPRTIEDIQIMPGDDHEYVEITVSISKRSLKFIYDLLDYNAYSSGSEVVIAGLRALYDKRKAEREDKPGTQTAEHHES